MREQRFKGGGPGLCSQLIWIAAQPRYRVLLGEVTLISCSAFSRAAVLGVHLAPLASVSQNSSIQTGHVDGQKFTFQWTYGPGNAIENPRVPQSSLQQWALGSDN